MQLWFLRERVRALELTELGYSELFSQGRT
jgi:hypothetical protein